MAYPATMMRPVMREHRSHDNFLSHLLSTTLFAGVLLLFIATTTITATDASLEQTPSTRAANTAMAMLFGPRNATATCGFVVAASVAALGCKIVGAHSVRTGYNTRDVPLGRVRSGRLRYPDAQKHLGVHTRRCAGPHTVPHPVPHTTCVHCLRALL